MTRLRWLVGNDVVDLREVDNASVGSRPRFLARVCDADEQARVRAAGDPVATLWALFAAKEAAYKVVAKLRPGAILAHRRFRVAPGFDAIDADGLRLGLAIELDMAAGSVHAVAWCGGRRPAVALALLTDDLTPSLGARRAATRLVAARLAIGEASLAIDRPALAASWDGLGPPVLLRDGRPIDLDVSLSHDDRFVAAAAAVA